MTVQKTLKIMPLQFAANTGDTNEELITRNKLDVTIQLEVDAEAAGDGNVLIRHYGNAYRAEDIHITDGPRMAAA